MKRALSILGQMFVMAIAAFTGMLFLGKLLPSLHIVHVISQQGFTRRQYEFDWLFATDCVYICIQLIGLATTPPRTASHGTPVPFLLTVLILALFTKFGFKDVPLLYGN